MKIFIEDFACGSGVHCVTCRDKSDGRLFRLSLGKVFQLPDNAPDFECPHGKPWGWQKPSTGLGDTFAKITKAVGIKPCAGCKKRQAILNKLVPYQEE